MMGEANAELWRVGCQVADMGRNTGMVVLHSRTVIAVQAEIEALRKDSELLAWVLEHPETAAECLEDAAAGDGTARGNLEFRRDALAGRIGAA